MFFLKNMFQKKLRMNDLQILFSGCHNVESVQMAKKKNEVFLSFFYQQ